MTDLRRKKELAKIHVAKKQLALDDEDYRAMLLRIGGRDSAGDLDQAGRTKVLEHLKSIGFDDKPRAPKRAGTRPLADGAEASKMRALWLALFQLGEVEDPSEAALAKYAQRMTGRAALQWLDGYEVTKVINTLRSWTERVGVAYCDRFTLSLINTHRRLAMLEEVGAGFGAKYQLIKALWQRCQPLLGGIALDAWLMQHFRVANHAGLSAEDADLAIAKLGAIVRREKTRRERA